MAQDQPVAQDEAPAERWSNRRIIFLAIIIAIIFYAIFHLPPTINYLLTRARQTVILLILAVSLAYLLLPAVDLLLRIPVPLEARFKRTLAALITIIVFTVLLLLLAAVIVTPITDELGKTLTTVTQWVQSDLATRIDEFFQHMLEQLPEPYHSQAQEQLDSITRQLSGPELAATIRRRWADWGGAILQWPLNLLSSVLSSGAWLLGLLIVPVFAFYFLTDASSMREGMATHVPPKDRQRYHRVLRDMDEVVRGYVRTIMIISLITGVATALTLYVAGVRVFLTFGILAGVANMVPVVGGVVAVVLITAISLLTVGLNRTIIILIVYGIIQLVSDRVIAPKLMSQGANLHPVAVIIALLVGAEFFGIIGVFVAVPVLAAARVAWIHYHAYMSDDAHGRELEELLGRPRRAEQAEIEPNAEEQPALDEGPRDADGAADAADDAAGDEDEPADGDA